MKDIRNLWKARAAAKQITSEDIAALCIYKSIWTDEDLDATKARLRKSFTPIRNQIKLENGATPFQSLSYALRSVKYSIFSEWLGADELALIVNRATELTRFRFSL